MAGVTFPLVVSTLRVVAIPFITFAAACLVLYVSRHPTAGVSRWWPPEVRNDVIASVAILVLGSLVCTVRAQKAWSRGKRASWLAGLLVRDSVQIDLGNVRVIVNESNPLRSTAYYR